MTYTAKTHSMPQRSDEWHAIRKGKLTASQVGDWLAEEAKVSATIADLRNLASSADIELPKSASKDDMVNMIESEGVTLPRTKTKKAQDAETKTINNLLGSLASYDGPPRIEIDPLDPPPLSPSLWAIWNGLRLEDEARVALEKFAGIEIEEIGFMEHEGGFAGCSPDGLVKGKSEGVEIKCPLAGTHVGYLREGILPATYSAQVHFSLAISGAEAWHFWSYCPGLPPFYIIQERNETTERMVDGIEQFTENIRQAKAEMAAMWDGMNDEEHGATPE